MMSPKKMKTNNHARKISMLHTSRQVDNYHRFLLIGKRDSHLFQSNLVQGACYLKTFGLLVFLKTAASVGVELAGLFAAVEAALLENRLRLFDLIGVGAEDWLSVRVGRLVTACRPVRVRVAVLILRCSR